MSDAPTAQPTDLIKFTLNGREVYAKPGSMLVDAAAEVGVEIPVFCYEPRLGGPIGACRMCLVEVEGMRGLQTACSTPVAAGMVVHSDNAAAKDAQDGVLELILANHPLDCPVCDKGGECPLQNHTMKFGPPRTRFVEPKRHFPKPLDLSTLVALDRERCITCFRCVRFSQDVAEDGQLTFQERGAGTEVATFTGEPYEGRFTGNIIDLCPVGALTSIPYRFVSRPWDIMNTPSVCGNCPSGCNVEITQRDGEIKRVTGRPEPNTAVEDGWLCDKGRWAYPGAWAANRITNALVRGEDGLLHETPLEEAVDRAAHILQRSAATGVLVGTGTTVEDGHLAAMLAQAMPGGRVGRLGVPDRPHLGPLRNLPRAELGDIDEADVVAVVGGDLGNQHPIVELRLRKLMRRRGTLLVAGVRPQIIASRATESITTAPGRLVDALDDVERVLESGSRPILIWDERDLANDDAAAARLAALAEAADARVIELVADVNGPGLRALGLTTESLLEDVAERRVSTLLTVLADPIESAGSTRWAGAIEELNDLVVIATHHSHITDRATVVLPGLMSQEVEGILVSTTGRAQRLRPGSDGPEGAAATWEILIGLSHRLGKPFPWRTPAQTFAAVADRYPAFAGLTYQLIGTEGAPIGDADVVPVVRTQAPEPVGEGLPLVLTTEIFGDGPAWRSDALASLRQAAGLRLSPGEAGRQAVLEGDVVVVESPHGSCALTVDIDEDLPDGAAFVMTGPPSAGVHALVGPDHGPVNVRIGA